VRVCVCVCVFRPGKWLSFSLGVHVTVFQVKTFVILAYAKEHIGKAYTDDSYRC
jgi:hypothetical protein